MRNIEYLFIILAGILIFVLSSLLVYKYINKGIQQDAYKKSLDSFYRLHSSIEDVCRSFTGEKRVLYIYVSERVSKIFSEKDKLCVIADNDKKCLDTTCNLNQFSIVYNTSEFYLQTYGKDLQTYMVEIEKVYGNTVNIRYKPYITE